jgi:hypothetical protein
VALIGIISVALTLMVYWIAKHRDGEARGHLLRLFGSAAIWSWYVALRNVVDADYRSPWWGCGNLVIGIVVLYVIWQCMRWILR